MSGPNGAGVAVQNANAAAANGNSEIQIGSSAPKAADAAQAEDAAPADIKAAETEHEFQVEPGTDEPAPHDGRRFPRLNFRACVNAVVHAPPGDLNGEPTPCQILTRDVSRGGMNILHKSQMFPGQWIDVTLPPGQERRLEVMWCRRLGVGCYSAGCRFVKIAGQEG